MKKIFLLLMLLTGLTPFFKADKACAQVTGITIIEDYGGPYGPLCSLPNPSFYTVAGTLSGTFTDADSMTVYMNFGDGFDTTYKIYDTAEFYTQAFHDYNTPGHFIQSVTVTAGGMSATMHDSLAVTLYDSCSTFTGKLYMDNNGNCVQDAGEPGISYFPVYAANLTTGDTSIWAFTDDTGFYSMDLPAGNYVILSALALTAHLYTPYQNNIAPSCPAGGDYAVTIAPSTEYSENFAFACNTLDTLDMRVDGWENPTVRGYNCDLRVYAGQLWAGYGGYTCSPHSATVTLTLDPNLTYVGVSATTPAPTSVSGSVITWDLTTTTDEFALEADVIAYCSLSTTLGETLCNTITTTPTDLTDPDSTNNTQTFCGTVRSSWDPNAIEVSPQGVDTPGYIPNNTPLSYEIHFQNTGTDTAYSITVDDTLDANIDVSSLRVINSSAPVFTYLSGNTIKFRFDDIYLPDSATNPTASIGTVFYTVMPKPALAPGTQIKARAGIYFDFNSPVVTNTALNTIELPASVPQVVSKGFDVSVYPNPASEEVTIQSADGSAFKVNITDMMGRQMIAKTATTGIVVINTHSIPAGIYLVKTTNSNGKELMKKITIQH